MKKNINYDEFKKQADSILAQKEKAEEQFAFSAERLRKAMQDNGATEKDIIAEAYKMGIYLPARYTMEIYVDRIVSGEMIPFARMIKAICIAVNVSADYLLNLSDKVN